MRAGSLFSRCVSIGDHGEDGFQIAGHLDMKSLFLYVIDDGPRVFGCETGVFIQGQLEGKRQFTDGGLHGRRQRRKVVLLG